MTLPTDRPAAADRPAESGRSAVRDRPAASESGDPTVGDTAGDGPTGDRGATDAAGTSDRPTLHFAYDAAAPSVASFDVKAIVPGTLLGAPAAFTVIGESHYVGAPAIEFHELCSCRPLDGAAFSVRLVRGAGGAFESEVGRVRVETEAAVVDLDEFPGGEGADAAYRFDPGAWTTIAADAGGDGEADAGYETYHTYPEYGLAVYTATRLARTAQTDAAGDSTRPPADSARPTGAGTGPAGRANPDGPGNGRHTQENP